MGIKAFVCCSSNTAVDTVAERIEAKKPGLKALRFHSMGQETRMLKSSAAKVQRASKNNLQAEPLKDANIVDSQDEAAEASQTNNQLTPKVGHNKGKGKSAIIQSDADTANSDATNLDTTNSNAANLDTTNSDDAKEDADLEELRIHYARVIPICLWIARKARSSRPNFQQMSLVARC